MARRSPMDHEARGEYRCNTCRRRLLSALWNGGDVETEVALQLCVRPFSTHSHIGKILSSPVLTRKNYPAAFSQIAFSEYLASTVVAFRRERGTAYPPRSALREKSGCAVAAKALSERRRTRRAATCCYRLGVRSLLCCRDVGPAAGILSAATWCANLASCYPSLHVSRACLKPLIKALVMSPLLCRLPRRDASRLSRNARVCAPWVPTAAVSRAPAARTTPSASHPVRWSCSKCQHECVCRQDQPAGRR